MSYLMQIQTEEEIKKEIQKQVLPASGEMTRLKEATEHHVASLLSKGREYLFFIEKFGLDTMERSSEKNKMLKTSVRNFSKTGTEAGEVSSALTEMQTILKTLDPNDVRFDKSGLFGKIFNQGRNYFQKVEKSDEDITRLLEALDRGKKVLRNDNITLGMERDSLAELTKTLKKEIELGYMIDKSIERKVKSLEDKFLEEEVLLALRKRLENMEQMFLVNEQGILAYELVIRNNKQLIRATEKVKTVTVSSLNIAVALAGVEYNQKISLSCLEKLSEQSITVGRLKSAFNEVMDTLDAIRDYEQKAFPTTESAVQRFEKMK